MERRYIDCLRSARRMELKSNTALFGGFYAEIGSAVMSGNDSVPDAHFNRISILDSDRLTQELLAECLDRMMDGMPIFIDVPHPVTEAARRLLTENGCHPTGESRSSMLLTDAGNPHQEVDGLEITTVRTDTLDLFLELFLRGFETPEDLVPPAKELFRDLILKQRRPENSQLYLGMYRGEPATTLYLFHEGVEGGINMVSTREDFRRKGLAGAVLRHAVEGAREKGVRLLSLETRWNGPPERLYRKLGFTTIARHEIFTNVAGLKYGL